MVVNLRVSLLLAQLVGGLVVAGVCSSCKDPAPTREQYRYAVTPSSPGGWPRLLKEQGAQVILNGKEVGKLSDASGSVELDVPASTWMSDPAVKLAFRATTTCGPADLALKMSIDKETEEYARRVYPSVLVHATFDQDLEIAGVYFDNVGKQASNVAIGKLTREVKAGEKGEVRVLVGSCPEARKVSAGGVEVGALTTEKLKHTLVDVVGGTCYETSTAQYLEDSRYAVDDRKLLSGARTYPVSEVGYFFEDPPPIKEVVGGSETSVVLKHVLCKK